MGSLDEFLLERYTAFTCCKSKRRFFRIWHEPWEQREIKISISNNSLLAETFPWFARAEFVGANYSPGAKGVWMGWPHAVTRVRRAERSGVVRVLFEMPGDPFSSR